MSASPKCPKCGKSVYKAEEVLGAGKRWHRRCFRCMTCGKGLDSNTLAERESSCEIYCRSCYGKKFGPKGYGFGQGAGVLAETGVSKKPATGQLVTGPTSFCGECGTKADGGRFCHNCGNALGGGSAAPKVHTAPAPVAAKPVTAAPTGRQAANFWQQRKPGVGKLGGGSDRCPKCSKAVYAAEKVMGAGKAWHKRCFVCTICNKRVDSTSMNDRNGKLFCRACYTKNFGPKGYGYGQGAGALAHTQ